jgi:nickel-dependent lactate racemase
VGVETIRYNHGNIGGFGPGLTPHETTGYLRNDDNVMRLDAEEAARMAGLDYKIDTVLNLRRDPLELYSGDFVETQRRAAAGTRKWHATESPEADVVVVGSYMRENEPYLGFWPAYNSVKPDGTIVLVNDDPDGDINHWLFNRHGKNTGASLWNPRSRGLARGKRLIIYGEHPLKSFEMRYEQEIFQWIRSWPEVIEELKKHHGKGSKVAVIPDGTSCIPRKALES